MTGSTLSTSATRPPIGSVDGYEYGNTRLRARRGELLGEADLRQLFASASPERMIGALRSTAYGPDVEHALVHHDPLHRLDNIVRHHLVRSFNDLRRFYAGRAAEGVELLLGRWDLRNLLAIVRATARPTAPAELESMLVPAGMLDVAALNELAQQPSLRSAIELMVAWDLPSRASARRVLRAWPDYEATGDPIVFEQALMLAWAEAVTDAITSWRGTDLELVLRSEIDRLNLLGVLRRRDDGSDAAPTPHEVDLPGGALARGVLDRVRRSPDTTGLIAALTEQHVPTGWEAALNAWSADQDLSALDGRLERALARSAVGLFVRGDPLGIAIPIAFVWAKECEAKNVRLIGRATVHRLAWVDIEPELFP